MDKNTFEQFDNFKNLSEEEKKEFVRELIHSEAAKSAAFYNPITGDFVSADGLVEHLGEEKAIEIIMNTFDDARSVSLTNEDVAELIMKAEKGECTEEELRLLDFVTDKIMKTDDHLQFEKAWLETTVDLLNFVQKEVGYFPKVHDLLTGALILVSTSGMVSDKGGLSKYDFTDVPIITEMSAQVADDIYDAWKNSCTSLPDPEITVIGLLNLALKIAHDNNLEFSKSDDIAKGIGLTLIDEYDKDDEDTNGSNHICKPNLYRGSSDDEEMRDLLKE